jgi:hypothetical protein
MDRIKQKELTFEIPPMMNIQRLVGEYCREYISVRILGEGKCAT